MEEQHTRHMREALKVAEEGLERGELPVGAVLVQNAEVIARAYSGEVETGRFLVHAEIRALDQGDRLKPFPGLRRDTILYTTLEPCLMCLGAAMSFFLGEIYYALESPQDGAVWLGQTFEQRKVDASPFPGYRLPKIFGGLLRDESRELMERYIAKHAGDSAMRRFAASLADPIEATTV